MALLTDAQQAFLREPHYAVVAVLRPDGTPQQSVVWVDWDGEHVLFNTAEGRRKPAYLRRDGRASVLVLDHPYRWLAVAGTCELTHEGAEEHIHALSRKYCGRDYTLPPAEQRILVRLTPERVTDYRM